MRISLSAKSKWIRWITAGVLVVISMVGWMRFQQALRHWYYLIDLNLIPAPIYLAVSGGLIGIAFGVGLIFHLAGNPFTPVYLRLITATLVIWLWIDRIFVGVRNAFLLLLAGTIFISLCLIIFDQYLFSKNSYPMKAGTDAPEN